LTIQKTKIIIRVTENTVERTVPEMMQPNKVKARLQTALIGRTIHFFRQVTSTNDIAKELAAKGAREGTVIVAETQTHGRGRLGREWTSPKGGIYLSLILRPKVSLKDASKLTLTTSVAAARTIQKLYHLKAQIKWPNDVQLDGKKVCGILTEAVTRGKTAYFVVVGIGVNANVDLTTLPPSLRGSSTSLKRELQREIEREEFLSALLNEVERYYNAFTRGKFSSVLKEWRSLCSHLDSQVKVTSFDETFEGQAVDVDENGALLVKLKDGTTQRVVSGDVTVEPIK